jgi:hypothetical protein
MESNVEMPVVRRAERAGWFVRKLCWVGRRGAPDRFFAKKGRIVLIEFKDDGKSPDLNQLEEHRQLREAGVEVHVCDRVEDALRVLGL